MVLIQIQDKITYPKLLDSAVFQTRSCDTGRNICVYIVSWDGVQMQYKQNIHLCLIYIPTHNLKAVLRDVLISLFMT